MGKNQEQWNSKLRFHLATKGSEVGIRAKNFSICLHIIQRIAECIERAVAYKTKSIKHRGEQWT